MKKLVFDADGFCVGKVSGITEGFTPPRDDLPPAAYYLLNDQVHVGTEIQSRIDYVDLGQTYIVQVPANTRIKWAGQLVKGPANVEISASFADRVVVVFSGALYGERIVQFQDYIAKRKAEYPPVHEQLEMIQEQGLEAWRSYIASIKAKYPRPS